MLWTGFVLGFLGSVHCVGMCGPIALAVGAGGGKAASARRFHLQKLVYHLGRTFTYSLLGLLIGLLGFSLFLAGMQQSLSLLAGLSLLLMAFFYKRSERLAGQGMAFRFVQKLRGLLARYLRQGSYRAHFFTGALNGLLPCGMVYLALLAAFALQRPWKRQPTWRLSGLGRVPCCWPDAGRAPASHALARAPEPRHSLYGRADRATFCASWPGPGASPLSRAAHSAPAVGVEMTLCGGM
ncbi:hypothetical protein A3SI_09088 [Nitritalea halalkaliphila LW7]|uniref:Urease accessory protein UreH-like transmembrane domain-containing protein n=1 Tax=Nitritalea halalkaliphila LW7 TaxID=1189621 RepID=I5C459_9BACT|nr:sulfite exporter TauE/SafE family protein [Nitritalea halalkaliphila]EIM76611.1 hypothetical protein A3SI_09088 [Nitritalea halalkaliphila LW7]